MEAIAKWDVETNSSDLLCFKKGDILKIMDKEIEDPQWYLAELNGEWGLVSENMIEIKPNSWYYGKELCKYSEAEAILLDTPSKLFLIRKSPLGGLYLSYKRYRQSKKVWHFKISQNKEFGTFNFFVDQEGTRSFFSLNQIADFVKNRSWYSAPWWSPSFEEISFKSYGLPRTIPYSSNY